MKFVPRSEATRQFIIETTANIFNTKGYAGTSMSDLTEATKLTKGAIYGNFKNKEEVALAVFDHIIAERDAIINQWMAEAKTNREKLLVLTRLFHSSENHVMPKGGCPLLNAGTEADDTFEPLRQRVAEELLDWRKNLIVIIRNGVDSGEFKRDLDVNKMAVAIMSLIEGGILLARTTRNPAHLDTSLDTVKDLIDNMSP